MNEESHKILVWHRRAGELREESVYRAGTLRFLFRNPLGRLAMRTLLSTKFFNNLITLRERSRRSRDEILPFIERHRIDVSEFMLPVESFESFDDFFTRELRSESRPVAAGTDIAVSPCDGRIQWVIPSLNDNTAFEIKGETYKLGRLTGDDKLAKSLVGGTLLGIYLSPFDYHRFCYPLDGDLISQSRLGGSYYSVNAESLAAGFRVFDHNIRQSTVLRRNAGTWAMIEVAGFYAGQIVDLDSNARAKSKGMMKGYFRLGGSFIVLAFEADSIRLDPDILEQLARDREVRVRSGEQIGVMETS